MMLTIRAFSLVLLLTFTFGFSSDIGCGIDPNGCHARQLQLTTQAGGEMDPNGGGAMDPNGSAQSGYSACLDPNGRCRER